MSALALPTERNPTPGSFPSQTARTRLRAATAEAHAALDRRFQHLDLTCCEDYRRFLAANAAALLPIERALERSGVRNLLPDWVRRMRSAAIRADLQHLGGRASPLPAEPRLDPGGMLGVLYVLEGSRLGARFLLKAVTRSPDPAVRAATAYLSHGEGQPLWPAFLAVLERAATTVDDAELIAGATRAFSLFARAAARA